MAKSPAANEEYPTVSFLRVSTYSAMAKYLIDTDMLYPNLVAVFFKSKMSRGQLKMLPVFAQLLSFMTFYLSSR